MIVGLKMFALILSMGMDTLLLSISVGFIQSNGQNGRKSIIAFTFASAEAFMLSVGLLIGQGAGRLIGDWASVLGGTLLLAVAVWLLFFEDDKDEEESLRRNLVGSTLIVTGVGISVDELVVGFSIGLVGVPILMTIFLVAGQAFLFTMLGLTAGSKVKPYLGEWAEKFTGGTLLLLGLWVLTSAIVRLVYS
jgi:putative Mn2+ efflux pump MntP